MLHLAAEMQRHEAKELENCPEHLNLHNAIGVVFLRMSPEQWQTYMRYDAAISRDFFRTLDALMRLQKARQHKIQQPEPQPEAQPALTRTAGAATQLSDSGTGSVSQPAAAPQKQEPFHRGAGFSLQQSQPASPLDSAPSS
jgi:hypothetical protein